ncbi:retinoblastoma-related protein 1-like isoform X2 [Raphanus sativus]|uniref:Retinoblastoma-related protein 1-like isoform X2 n=1 Tax=Raphanus sativus TaxID=3726 RepID=A0A6J0LVN9_RAPSA|nr:retinoblastoma-related protein 1-like isoform X2 [Raphanus sativus]KAJ4882809.1 retinoblastoma-related protein 1-like isoform X2 [Raphanus sativus]
MAALMKQRRRLRCRRNVFLFRDKPPLRLRLLRIALGGLNLVSMRMCFLGESQGNERARRIISCKICGKKYHKNCVKSWAQHRDLFHWSLWSCPFVRRCDAAYHCESLNTNGLVSILAILIIHIPCRFRNFSIQDSSRFDFRWIAEILQESAKSFSA